ncbi:pentatricopeptide repeat-containing protein At4g02750-like [Durio zibethinus]|uniref:Pentatricopeptide repeat-containing protein At4g02750-like n=1 Tax=Durio zibethinus TaxID=66656 RepID=A0A6P5YHV7_DURZI|nr:pentatricopeptide repeat-containing protein At4g02750-like [Durio zibethinus]
MLFLRFSLQTTPFNSPSLLPLFQIPFPFYSLQRYFTLTRHPLPPKPFFSARDVYVCNVRIGRLSRAGNIKVARQLFDNMPAPDVVSWNSIITAYWQNGCLQESKTLFGLMPGRNILSWNSMIAGCVENGSVDEAFEYFKAMPERNIQSYNAMISGFVRWQRVNEAGMLFQEMPRKNVISYTAMIDGYLKIGEVEKARALFDGMPRRNVVSWTVMISGYVDNGKFDEARDLYERMPNKNIVAMTAMISGYFKEGRVEDARALFDGIRNKDLVCWNAMIAGYAQNGIGEQALKLCSEMVRLGIQLDNLTLVSVLTACSGLASVKEGRQMHVLVIKNGFELDLSLCNSLITMYSKCGSILDAEHAFRQMNGAGLVSWNTIISAFAQHGFYEKAIDFFNQMEVVGFKPDGVTFLSLLSACGHAGKVNESMKFFDLMVKKYGIYPRPEHYSCLVDILSRAGQLEKASKIIREMPFEADAGVWGALLAACSVYLNVELGELAAKKIVKWNPEHSGAYVVLSNIYAAAGMWDEVTRVRLQMKDQGVKKQCAYSWMEIGNKVHHFLGGDISHPDTNKIHSEIKSISLQMKSLVNIAEIDLLWSGFG